PFSILRGVQNDDMITRSAEMAARHTKYRGEESLNVLCWPQGSKDTRVLTVKAASAEEAERIRL
ncbi:MAG: hypothetical protein V1682_06315, partial [Candidatus Omnitrophota bacterium]